MRSFIYIGAKKNLGGYGRLYNWYAYSDDRLIYANNARLITPTDLDNLSVFLATNPGGKLKETGLAHWNDPNDGATDEYGFNARGAGFRRDAGGDVGTFEQFKDTWFCWTTMAVIDRVGYITTWNGGNILGTGFGPGFGLSVRLIIDSPIEIVGNSAIYVGNDLRRYKCVLINGIWFLAENLAETKFRDGSDIPYILTNSDWASLTTSGMCDPNGDPNNA